MVDLKSLSKNELDAFIKNQGLPDYRADQLIHWMYARYASRIDEITEFSRDLRIRLNKSAYISNLKIMQRSKSSDGTEKFLFALQDEQTIESVLIPDGDRLTLCVSSQVGCALGCLFCLTGKGGFIRNLKAHEIVDQIIAVNRTIQNNKITNIVFMGMGEPLMNFDNVVEALRRIVDFIGISKRKITLSTAGIVSKMLLLPRKAPEVNLAVSLNAATDEVRNKIMPVNKQYSLAALIEACRRYPLKPGRRITVEYVMIDGLNDSLDDAKRLIALLKGLKCKLNLIPLNPHQGDSLKRPSQEKVLAFQKMLFHHNRRAMIRESRGQDILAACGQLRASSSVA
jgi:23S rRNA (adenine2503-C2)-methyltransferase